MNSRRLIVAAGIAAGLVGCERLEKLCAGPCVKASVCGAGAPFGWLVGLGGLAGQGGTGGAGGAGDACQEACVELVGRVLADCREPALAALDCYSQLSCDELSGETMFAYACGSEVVEYFSCSEDFALRCCRRDDPCGRADNGACECCYQAWDDEDCRSSPGVNAGCYYGAVNIEDGPGGPPLP